MQTTIEKQRHTLSQEHYSQKSLREMMANCIHLSQIPGKINVITNTSDFFRVEYNDVVIIHERPYLIRNNKREGRFGISDEPKFWVKSAIDLITSDVKIMKLVHHEKFKSRVGGLEFDCFRSPKKEARILDLVKGHPSFMQGFSAKDSAGNIVRIIDNIPGRTMASYILDLGESHEDYFHNYFPTVLEDYIELVTAIGFLHENREKHGDIRRDHILKNSNTGIHQWIDFDFNYVHKESMFRYDLFGLGNILVYLAGRGDVTAHYLRKYNQGAYERLNYNDMNIVFKNRVVNLKKIYPYIPESLNLILLHFSAGANIFYDNVPQLINDIIEVKEDIT
jgi:hypothetical protein